MLSLLCTESLIKDLLSIHALSLAIKQETHHITHAQYSLCKKGSRIRRNCKRQKRWPRKAGDSVRGSLSQERQIIVRKSHLESLPAHERFFSEMKERGGVSLEARIL